MNDDELGRRLRGETPPPKTGYWDDIDARLTAVAQERTASAEAARAGGDTEERVVRLTDMTGSSAPDRRRVQLLAAAAIVAAVLGAGAAFLALRGDGDGDTVVAEEPPATTVPGAGTIPDTAPDTVGPSTTRPPDPAASATTIPPDDDQQRRCFSSGELGGGVVAYLDISADDQLSGIVRSDLPDRVVHESVVGSFTGGDGLAAVSITEVGGPGRLETEWRVAAPGLSIADDVFVESVPCESIVAEISEMQTFVASAPTVEPATPLPEVEPGPVAISGEPAADERVGAVVEPGSDITTFWIGAGAVGVTTTGERSSFEGAEWLRISAGDVFVGWLPADLVEGADPVAVGEVLDGSGRAVVTVDRVLVEGGAISFRIGERLLDVPDDAPLLGGSDDRSLQEWAEDFAVAEVSTVVEVTIDQGVVRSVDQLITRDGVGGRLGAPVESAEAEGRVCFGDGTRTLVLDFSEDAETFVGGLRTVDDGPRYDAVAGRRTVGSAFAAIVLVDGEQRTEEWVSTARGIQLDDEFLDARSCSDIAADVLDVVENVTAFPEPPPA